jgi:hypothetical protein
MRKCAPVFALLVAFSCACSRHPRDRSEPASETSVHSATLPGHWPAPQLTRDEPIALRVDRTDGHDEIWAYGGKNAIGIAVLVRWRDASGAIVDWTSQTGGLLSPTDGWWRYGSTRRMNEERAKKVPPAVSAEAQAYELVYADGTRWRAPHSMKWRYAATGKTLVSDKEIAVELTTVEREYRYDGFQGTIVLLARNLGARPKKRVEIACQIVGADADVELISEYGAGEPMLAHDQSWQIEMPSHALKTPAERELWERKDFTPQCKVKRAE